MLSLLPWFDWTQMEGRMESLEHVDGGDMKLEEWKANHLQTGSLEQKF
jgi:hypothetical protein